MVYLRKGAGPDGLYLKIGYTTDWRRKTLELDKFTPWWELVNIIDGDLKLKFTIKEALKSTGLHYRTDWYKYDQVVIDIFNSFV